MCAYIQCKYAHIHTYINAYIHIRTYYIYACMHACMYGRMQKGNLITVIIPQHNCFLCSIIRSVLHSYYGTIMTKIMHVITNIIMINVLCIPVS